MIGSDPGRRYSWAPVVVCAALSLTGMALFWYEYITPLAHTMNARRAEVASLKGDMARSAGVARELALRRGQLDQLQADATESLRALAGGHEIGDLLQGLQTLAAQAGLRVLKFTPQAAIPHETYTEWSARLHLEGSFHRLLVFLEMVGSAARVISLSALQLGIAEEASPPATIAIECTVSAFGPSREAGALVAAPGTVSPVLFESALTGSGAAGLAEESRRRDPFANPVQRGGDVRSSMGPRPTGLSGLSTADVTLHGTVRSAHGLLAILRGIDGRTYIVRAGDQLFDGTIAQVAEAGLVIEPNENGRTRGNTVSKELSVGSPSR